MTVVGADRSRVVLAINGETLRRRPSDLTATSRYGTGVCVARIRWFTPLGLVRAKF